MHHVEQQGAPAIHTQQGRKGLTYDWQSIFAAAQAESLDRELAALAPEFAE